MIICNLQKPKLKEHINDQSYEYDKIPKNEFNHTNIIINDNKDIIELKGRPIALKRSFAT